MIIVGIGRSVELELELDRVGMRLEDFDETTLLVFDPVIATTEYVLLADEVIEEAGVVDDVIDEVIDEAIVVVV